MANTKRSSNQQDDKTFPVRLPYELWRKAKLSALNLGITLHEFIVQAIQEKAKRNSSKDKK